jgi:cytochrome P450
MLPPGHFGLPVIGEMAELYSDFYGFAQRRYARYGPIFKSHANGKRAIVLLSAEAQHYVLLKHQENFIAHTGYEIIDPLLGEALLLLDGTVHRQRRTWMTPAFHGRNMGSYLTIMNRVFNERLDSWGASGKRAFYPEAAAMTFQLGAAMLLGIELRDDTQRLLKLWMTYADGVRTVLHIPGPFTKFGKAMIAKQRIATIAQHMIAEQRNSDQMNVIKLLAEARDENGEPIPEEQLITQLRFLMFASYDTTTGTLSWLLAELLRHPELLARVRDEVQGDAPLTYEDLNQHRPLTDAVIEETLRLHPQVMMFARGIKADDEFGGYTLPAGWVAVLLPVFTNRLPDYFTNPLQFDPDRFLPPREEHKAHPYSWVGFGGGAHACLGENTARIEIKALLTLMLRRYPELRLAAGQDLSEVYLPLSRPKSDVFIEYKARSLA